VLQTNRLQNTLRVVVATLSLLAASDVTAAEPISPQGRYFPYSQITPPGVTAYHLQQLRPSECYYTQPIRIELPGSGSMGVFVPGSSAYGGAALQSLTLSANNSYQIAVGVGHTYRMRIADMQISPGAELYPSIEALDRLHPPAALKHDFPIPVVITEKEIEHALAGKLVTKVIYLEQPQLAAPRSLDETDTYRTVTLPNRTNLLAEADLRGRPLLILRLGSRRPAPNSNNAGFFGNGGPVEESFPSGRLAAGKTRLRFVSGQRRAEISAR
jgi:hypothetical protein